MVGRRDRRQVHSSASRESLSIQDPVVIPDRTNPTFNVNDDNAAKKSFMNETGNTTLT